MSHQDPIAKFFTTVRNAQKAGHLYCDVPRNKVVKTLLSLMREEGYVEKFHDFEIDKKPFIRVGLRYFSDNKPMISAIDRVSKVGSRVYVSHDKIPHIRNGLGTALISTSKGVMTGRVARQSRLGGEFIGKISS